MIRRFFALGALVGVLMLTACGTDVPDVPVNVNIDGTDVSVSADTSDITGSALHTGLTAHGFKPNSDKTAYEKDDVTILVTDGKPSGVKYKNQELQNCSPTEESVLFGAATGLLGGSEQDVASRFCGN